MTNRSYPPLSPRLERPLRWAMLGFVALWLVLCSQQPHLPVNPASRYAGMEALVEHGTFAIDDTRLVRATVDKVQWEGHFYSSKPPLLYTLAAPIYAGVIAVTGETFSSDRYATAMAMRPFVAVLPWVLGLLVWQWLVGRMCPSPHTRLWAFAAMALGGLPTAYGSHLDNHSLSVVALLVAAWGASPLLTEDDWQLRHAGLGGLFGGLAVTFDLGSGPLVGAVGLWVAWVAFRRRAWGALAVFVAAGLIAPAAQMIIQFAIAGTVKPFYLMDSAYQYERSYWSRPVEFDALNEPPLKYATHALIGHHGLFSHTPWLVLGLPWFVRRETSTEANGLRFAVGASLLFIIGYYILNTVNYGGRCVGMRWFMILHVPLGLAAVRQVQRLQLVSRYPVVLGLLVGWSAVTALTGAINPWEEGFVYALFRAVGAGSIAG